MSLPLLVSRETLGLVESLVHLLSVDLGLILAHLEEGADLSFS